MLIAEKKRKENIAEYILYMWQLEDLIRASDFQVEHLHHFLTEGWELDQKTSELAKKWYADLIAQMKREQIQKKGHLSTVMELVTELEFLHLTLLNVKKNPKYAKLYESALPHIQAFKQKADRSIKSEVELCLVGLYGLLTLRIRKEKVSEDTENALMTFRDLMAQLSHHYKKMKSGETDFTLN